MKKFYLLITFTIVLCSCSSEINPLIDPDINLDKEKSIFLNKIKKGTDSIKGISIQLTAYNKIGDIESEEQVNSIIEEMTDDENMKFFSYDSSDETLKDLKTLKIKDIKNSNLVHKAEIVSKFQTAQSQLQDFLRKTVNVGNSIYQLQWNVNGKIEKSKAIFNSQEFVYDHYISNLTTFKRDKITSDKTVSSNSEKQQTYRKAKTDGREISAYFMGGVDRGIAKVITTMTYDCICEDGGTGASYCRPYLVSANTDAYCEMTWGSCDAQYKKFGSSPGTVNGSTTIYYGMYLATTGVSINLQWNGSNYMIGGTVDYSSMEFATGDYSLSLSNYDCI